MDAICVRDVVWLIVPGIHASGDAGGNTGKAHGGRLTGMRMKVKV